MFVCTALKVDDAILLLNFWAIFFEIILTFQHT